MKKTEYVEKRQIILKLTVGQEHELLTTQKIDDPDALMYPSYQQAVRALKEIADSAARWHTAHGRRPYSRNALYGYANNTIAFCGSRGQGKTSAMLSFCNALDKKSSISRELDTDGAIAGNRFYVMDPIDPTMLKKGGHITEIVLSYLYTQMKGQLSRGAGASLSLQEKEELLRRFQQAFGWLRSSASSGEREEFYDYERLGHGFDIRETLYYLIQKFLELRSNSYSYESCDSRAVRAWGENSFLVIPLDDIDLQLQNSYDMLEEIRQYLQLPNTVVLMAADIGQLRNMTNLYYRREMNPAAECKLMDAADFRRLAAKYMDKLIPVSQMIFLPEYHLSFRNGEEIAVQINDEVAGSSAEPQELHENLFDLIFRKVGLVFMKHESYLHNLIPTTLRGLQQLYRLLNTMPDPGPLPALPLNILDGINSADFATKERTAAEANRTMCEYLKKRLRRVRQQCQNLSVFKSYFMGDWCASKLDEESENVLKTISRSAIPTAYATALEALKEWCEKESLDINSIFLSPVDKDTASYSALCDTLDKLTKKGTDRVYRLAFAVHTIFSIQFTEEALLEQRRKIESELKKADLSKRADVFRFGLAYDSLEKRFGCGLLNKSSQKNPRDNEVKEILKSYVRLLRACRQNLSNNAPYTKLWQYWDAQDWAVLVCCNWEIQDRISKNAAALSKGINALNDKLLEAHPLSCWGSDEQKNLIKNEFASFLSKDPEIRLDKHGEQHSNENMVSLVNNQFGTILSLVKRSIGKTPKQSRASLEAAANALFATAGALRTYLNPELSRRLSEMSETLLTAPFADENTYYELNDLFAQVRKELETNQS